MILLESALDYIKTHESQFIADVSDCLKIPSISTDPNYKPDILRCAEHVIAACKKAGLSKVEYLPAPGYPMIYAEWLEAPGKPTILIYAHYDVQPADPAELWTTPAFTPTERDGYLYARGMSDNKGQLFCFLKSIESYLKTSGKLPVNIKLLIEGEEETGSPHFHTVLASQKERLKADVGLIADTPMFGPQTPSICVSLKGLTFVEVEVTSANSDLHSGQHGGPVPNAILTLCDMVSKLKTADNQVAIPGFYDDVLPIPDTFRHTIQNLPFSEADYCQQMGFKGVKPETGYSVLEHQWVRPTIEANGIIGGYTGAGSKTIVPCSAKVKLSMRLVPNQTPEKATALFKAYLAQITPPNVKVTVKERSGYRPARMNTDTPAMKAAKQALLESYGLPASFTGDGGSIPAAYELQHVLGIDAVLLGFYLRSDNIHAPNERMSLKHFQQGIESCARFFYHYGA